MNRFDYRAQPAPGLAVALVFAARTRVPLLLLLAAFVFDAVLAGEQRARIAELEREHGLRTAQLDALRPAVLLLRDRERALERLRRIAARIAQLRSTGRNAAASIAEIGNTVPPGAWLTLIRVDAHSASVEGRSGQLSAIATALTSAARLPGYDTARLIAIRGTAGGTLSYSMVLELPQ
ncbi:MAG: hypothetical protein JOZ24_02475 [Candidatus Eremiobacteraeota bacterium]|nr:hypothetical protein [Candidatus Eremiobacteraeota bacterium]